MQSQSTNLWRRLLFPPAMLLFFCVGIHRLSGLDVAPSPFDDLFMSEESKPLMALGKKDFPDVGGAQSGLSASVLAWPVDLPDASHQANSILARIAFFQYEPGGGRKLHRYSYFLEQAFYVIAGRAQFTLSDSKKEVGPGDMVFVPSTVSHAYEVVGNVALKLLVMQWGNGDLSKAGYLSATVVSEKLKPLTRLSATDSGGHRGISATPFVTAIDYPTLSHKANSQTAWISLQQYVQDPKNTSPHSHATLEHAFYLLEGKARFLVGDLERNIGPGELVFLPRHVKHGYTVLGDAPIKWLMMSWPSEVRAPVKPAK